MGPKQGFRIIAIAAVASLGLASGADAQGWHHGRGDGGMIAIAHKLDLSSQQRQEIHALLAQDRQSTEATRAQLRSVSEQMRTEMFSTGSVTSAQLVPLLQQQEQLRATLDQSRLTTMLAVRAILTPSQLQQASSLHADLASLHAQEHALLAPPAASSGTAPSE